MTQNNTESSPVRMGKKFAICDVCNKEMSHGCTKHWYIVDGVKLLAVKQGDDGNYGVCRDCNARPGEYHHPGCDNERCPKCGGQMIGFHDCKVAEEIYVSR